MSKKYQILNKYIYASKKEQTYIKDKIFEAIKLSKEYNQNSRFGFVLNPNCCLCMETQSNLITLNLKYTFKVLLED